MASSNASNNGKARRASSSVSKSGRLASIRVASANAERSKRRVRQFCTTDGFIQLIDSLPKTEMPLKVFNSSASERREWLITEGFTPVAVYDDGFCQRRQTMKPESVSQWRPAHALLIRIQSLAGIGIFQIATDTYENARTQFNIISKLNWNDGLPDSFNEGDLAFIYRVANK